MAATGNIHSAHPKITNKCSDVNFLQSVKKELMMAITKDAHIPFETERTMLAKIALPIFFMVFFTFLLRWCNALARFQAYFFFRSRYDPHRKPRISNEHGRITPPLARLGVSCLGASRCLCAVTWPRLFCSFFLSRNFPVCPPRIAGTQRHMHQSHEELKRDNILLQCLLSGRQWKKFLRLRGELDARDECAKLLEQLRAARMRIAKLERDVKMWKTGCVLCQDFMNPKQLEVFIRVWNAEHADLPLPGAQGQ